MIQNCNHFIWIFLCFGINQLSFDYFLRGDSLWCISAWITSIAQEWILLPRPTEPFCIFPLAFLSNTLSEEFLSAHVIRTTMTSCTDMFDTVSSFSFLICGKVWERLASIFFKFSIWCQWHFITLDLFGKNGFMTNELSSFLPEISV